MPQIKKEDLVLNDKIKFDAKGGAILGVLEGPVADFMHSTRNGRMYSEDLWEKVFKNPIVKEQFENGGIVGELDHPADRDDICTEKVAVIMPEPPVKKNGEYYGKFNILDTPCGRIVYTLAKAGFKLGVSSRGTGDVDDYTNEVDPDTYDFTCFDVVLLPAVKTARMNLVTESLNKKNVDYKTLLKESLDNSSEAEKKIMEETLDNLHISLTEDAAPEAHECCICGHEFEGFGNNPWPVKEDGLCCDECNWTVVIPARLEKAGYKLNEDLKLQIKGPEDQDWRNPDKPEDGSHIKIDSDIWSKVEDKSSKDPIEWDCDGWSCKIIKEAVEEEAPEEAIVEIEPAEAIPETEEPKEEEIVACEECNAKLKELLHQFLEKEHIELEEDDDVEAIENDFIELFHEVACDECKPEEVADIEEVPTADEEAVDDGSAEVIEQLQKTLKENQTLRESIKTLQDEKAVSNTKVEKLAEDLSTFKIIAAKAGKKALSVKDLENENKELGSKVKSLTEELNKKQETCDLQESRIAELTEEKKLLDEKLDVLSESSDSIEQLQEEFKSMKHEADKKLEESVSRNKQLISLVEKYKGLAHDVAERYIESKATSLGITVNEIKNRLNESYTLDDVDKVCEELEDYSLNISRLPFALDKPDSAKIRIREDKSKDPLRSLQSQYDDTVDDYLLDLAGLHK